MRHYFKEIVIYFRQLNYIIFFNIIKKKNVKSSYQRRHDIAEILLKMALSTIIGNTSDTVELKYDDCRGNYDNQISKKNAIL